MGLVSDTAMEHHLENRGEGQPKPIRPSIFRRPCKKQKPSVAWYPGILTNRSNNGRRTSVVDGQQRSRPYLSGGS
jgi:hypothetical protein